MTPFCQLDPWTLWLKDKVTVPSSLRWSRELCEPKLSCGKHSLQMDQKQVCQGKLKFRRQYLLFFHVWLILWITYTFANHATVCWKCCILNNFSLTALNIHWHREDVKWAQDFWRQLLVSCVKPEVIGQLIELAYIVRWCHGHNLTAVTYGT